jgi:hypothetical protein
MYEKIFDIDKSCELLNELNEIIGWQFRPNIKRHWATDDNYLDGSSNYLVSRY